MSELTGFISARLDEDEVAARACAEAFPPPWEVSDRGHSAAVKADAPHFRVVAVIDQADETPGRWPGDHLDHIARHDPARVLAQIKAMRQIVALHETMPPGLGQPAWCAICEASAPCGTLRALASIWRDHEDYDPAWTDE